MPIRVCGNVGAETPDSGWREEIWMGPDTEFAESRVATVQGNAPGNNHAGTSPKLSHMLIAIFAIFILAISILWFSTSLWQRPGVEQPISAGQQAPIEESRMGH
ncbi:hypothetical protein [Novosphingobium sp. RL4]|nr:hypothetical protein [Novosphingobium sp. RL4]WRT93794.1 hypothetical protein U9J33_04565 [Novosphingobium sp. RL4]